MPPDRAPTPPAAPPSRRGAVTGLAAAALGAGCSPLAAFNTLAPRDAARQVGQGLSYGPDPQQALDLYAPPGGAKGAPVVVFVHGGAWDSGRRQDYGFAGRALAAQGFLAAVIGYRLVPQVRYPAFVEDAAAAVAWLAQHAATYGGDPQRIALTGHSAGAYIAMMTVLDTDFLRAQGLQAGVIKAAAGLSGPYDFLPLAVASTQAAFGAWPNLPQTQPINHVHPGAPPIFLAHGTKDDLVWPRNSVRLAAALTAAGDEAQLKLYPGLTHADVVLALSRPFRGKAPVLADLAAFLHAHLGA